MAKGFKSGVGGMPVNFKVVSGTSAPELPMENTIWVNTDTAISGWIFSSLDPDPQEGLVWILTGRASPVQFNAVRRNTVMVYPVSVKQYIGGEWVYKTAKIWNGEWTLIAADTIIYDSGTTYIPLTFTSAVALEEYISVTIAEGGKAYVKTTDPVNITAQSKVSVDYSNLSGGSTGTDCYITLMVIDASGETAASSTRTNKSSGTITLDIASLVGEYTIQVYCNNASGSVAGKCRISKIQLLL